jgi:hypothetical protein
VFIAVFVYIAAHQESLLVQARARLEGIQVGAVNTSYPSRSR